MMDDTIRSALRIAKADGGELNSLPEDAPVPRNPDEAARMLAEHRQKIYASSQEPLKAEMEGITSSREWQDQQQEQINRQSFSPERMQRMSAEPQPIAVQREGLGLPNFNTPQQDNFEAQRAVEMARAITNEENRKELKAGLKQTWPVQMAEDIYMAARAPGDALQGKLDPNSDLAIKRMFDLAGATAMQAPIAMATKPDPSKIGIFGGAGARTADQSLLKQAQAAAERGMAEQDIWRDTGWWKAPDGQWRFEIPDQTMILHGPEKAIQRLTKENAELLQRSPANEQERAALANQLRNNETELRGAQKGNVLLREAMDHPALFEAYPALKDMRVKFKDLGEANMGGYYQPGANGQLGHIVINSAASREFQRSVMAHELQHTVQRIEGFASGANPSEFDFPEPMRNRLWEERIAIEQALRIQKIAKESGVDPKVAANVFGGVLESRALEYVNEAPERLQKVLGMVQDVQSLTKQNGYAGYHRTMGEVEARNVQERLGDNPNSNHPDISRDINQTQRALNQLEHPGLTQDVPTGQQIYRSWEERMAAPAASAAPERQLSPIGLYSHGAETATLLPQPRGTPQQMRAMLERAGVKPDELKGFDEAFAGQKQITREQAAEFFNERMPKVEETIRRSTDNVNDEMDAMGEIIERASNDRSLYERITANDSNAPKWDSTTPDSRIEYLSFDNPEIVSDHIRFNQTEILPPKYSEYTLPGGENYREVLLRLPSEDQRPKIEKRNGKFGFTAEDGTFRAYRTLEDAQKVVNAIGRHKTKEENKFQSSHWDEPNVLAHIRMADRTGPNGERILHVEEMQSDWAQKGRKEGFGSNFEIIEKDGKFYIKNKNTSELYMNRVSNRPYSTPYRAEAENMAKNILSGSGAPPAPYVTNTQGWTDLALKRILKEAVDNGYESVVWTPGAEQAKRYDLSKQISRVTFQDNNSGGIGRAVMEGEPKGGQLTAYDLNGRKVIERNITELKQIEDLIGKEPAKKLFEQKPTEDRSGGTSSRQFELAGQSLSVGGEGMRGYYDRIVPTQLQKLLKKIDPEARLGRTEMPDHEALSQIERLEKRNLDARRSIADLEKSIVGNPHENFVNQQKNFMERWRRDIEQRNKEIEVLRAKNHSMLSIQITPRMREAIMKGLPAYKDGGAVAPSEAQIAAGNYKKKHIRFAGLDIAIENEKRSIRSGKDKGGKRWSVEMPADYGYIKRTSGADGDHVDVYVGPHENSRKVFIINQKDLHTDNFDEHKCMLGFNSQTEAMSCYNAGFSDRKGKQRAASVKQLSMHEFKQWLNHGDQMKVADDKSLAKALKIASSTGPDAAQRAVNLASSKGA